MEGPFGRVLLSTPADLKEGLELCRDVGGKLDRILHNVMDQGIDRVGVERGLADMQFVQDHA